VAADAMVGRKTFGHLAWRVSMRRRFFGRPNVISMRLRRVGQAGLPRQVSDAQNACIREHASRRFSSEVA
jgi:hypothetical protein